MEIIITIAIVGASLFFLVKKVKATKNADCTACKTCDSDCSVYTPKKAMGIKFINSPNEETNEK